LLTAIPRFAERGSSTNQLLLALPEDDSATWLATLEPVALPLRAVLHEPNATIAHVYFPDRGAAASLIASLGVDRGVEVGTVGGDGLVGLPILFGVEREPFLAVIQVGGTGWRSSAGNFRKGLEASAALRIVCARYAQSFRVQVGQASACNRTHTVEQRCSRWLLMMHDRAQEAEFSLTQDFLASMLGVRRAGVTVAAGALQRAGLIHYHRGHITVIDRKGLEAASCACYFVIRDSYAPVGAAATAPCSRIRQP
jgi:CRP-like cAMP-binding protein